MLYTFSSPYTNGPRFWDIFGLFRQIDPVWEFYNYVMTLENPTQDDLKGLAHILLAASIRFPDAELSYNLGIEAIDRATEDLECVRFHLLEILCLKTSLKNNLRELFKAKSFIGKIERVGQVVAGTETLKEAALDQIKSEIKSVIWEAVIKTLQSFTVDRAFAFGFQANMELCRP